MKQTFYASFVALSLLQYSETTQAQQYPTRPLRLVVVFTPGGADDFHGRLLAQQLTEHLGQQVIVDNRPGAGGLVGWEHVARSAPDGHTLLLAGSSLSTIPTLRPNAPINVETDFTFVSLFATSQLLMVVHPNVPAKNVKELIALARSRPGKLTYGSSGIGATPHLSAELFRTMAKLDMVHVPYKGAAPAYVDLVAGQIDLYIGGITGVYPQVQAGKLRALGVTGAKRSAILPDVPTIAEAGLPGYEVTSWYALAGPANLPAPVVQKLEPIMKTISANPSVRDRLRSAGSEPAFNTRQDMAAMLKSYIKKFGDIVRAANIKVE